MEDLLTLDELCSRVGLSVRNVRFYTSRGLVPPPLRRGRSGYYTPEHVARLELVQELQAHGFTLSAIERYVARIPDDATHLVVSAGGNDALGHSGLLDRPARSSAEVLGWLADAVGDFARRYRAMLTAVLARGLPTTVCTVYNGNLGAPLARPAAAALAVFNDAIQQLATELALAVIELRRVCTEPADYANPIEPSVQGGGKIARAIARAVAR